MKLAQFIMCCKADKCLTLILMILKISVENMIIK